MNKKHIFGGLTLFVLGLVLVAVHYFHDHTVAVLSPQGPVAQHEKSLIITALLLSLIIVIPVFTLTFIIAWRYRIGNTKATYSPDFDRNRVIETIWWLVPSVLILIISAMDWSSSHQLDPYKALVSTKKPLTIQVVALDWKWLFIYPRQDIASVNYVQFPARTPVNFQITSDATMNSFWIPRLGGQIYAMTGMSTELHLMASDTGSFRGSSANISGAGFAGMKFTAKATSDTDFSRWVASTQHSSRSLSLEAYNALAKPSQNNAVAYYSSGKRNLYNLIVSKYMVPGVGAEIQ